MKSPLQPLVYILDDDEAFRKSLQWMLRAARYRLRVFATGEHFLATYEPGAGACLVLDLRMPGMSGLEVQEELLRRGEPMPIVFVTAHGDVGVAVRAVKRGAFDFIEKPFKGKALLDLIERAVRQDPRRLAVSVQRVNLAARIDTLSLREHEVMERVIEGKTNKAIAGELGVTVKTVESHRSHMMEKLGAASIAELVRLVVGTSEHTTR